MIIGPLLHLNLQQKKRSKTLSKVGYDSINFSSNKSFYW